MSSLATLCASASSPSMVTAHSLVKCPAEATAANSGNKYIDRIFALRSFTNATQNVNKTSRARSLEESAHRLLHCPLSALQCCSK